MTSNDHYLSRSEKLRLAHINERNLCILAKIYEFAKIAHEGQFRLNGDHYISHPLSVYKILRNEFQVRDIVTLATAYLHDVVEDCHCTFDELRLMLENTASLKTGGLTLLEIEGILSAVESLTLVLPDDCSPLKKRDLKTIMILGKLATANQSALFVKMADRIDNVRSMSSSGWKTSKKMAYVRDGISILTFIRSSFIDDKLEYSQQRAIIDRHIEEFRGILKALGD